MIEIPKETLEKWRQLKTSEDNAKMAAIYGSGGYPEMFLRAMQLGRCNEKVFKVMDNYYKQKAKKLKALVWYH